MIQSIMFVPKAILATASTAIIAVLIVVFKTGDDSGNLQKQVKTVGNGQSFAVVELFTSEGCSSCPPADQLLGNIIKNARKNNKRVFGLAFHVDYWNDLGWKDIYSSAAYTHRQRKYAMALHSSSLYTPEMVVNGQVGFVGSNESRAKNRIQKALNHPAPVSVTIGNVKMIGNDRLGVQYKVSQASSDALVHLAVVERGVVRQVKRGENSGLTMHHQNVVRAFKTLGLNNDSGSVSLKIPSDVDINKASVVAYVQNENNMQILGAQGTDLKKENG